MLRIKYQKIVILTFQTLITLILRLNLLQLFPANIMSRKARNARKVLSPQS